MGAVPLYLFSLPFLVALQKHAQDVLKNPHKWLPWNYEAAIATLSV